jgi:hypothetical protein
LSGEKVGFRGRQTTGIGIGGRSGAGARLDKGRAGGRLFSLGACFDYIDLRRVDCAVIGEREPA